MFVCSFLLIFCPLDPHICADPDPDSGRQNFTGSTDPDPDPTHCITQKGL